MQFSNPEYQHYFDLGLRAGANKILLHQCDEEMKMQLLAGCIQPVREYILQHGGIIQTFKECSDKGTQYLRTMDRTQAIDRKRTEPEKGALVIGGTPKEGKTKPAKRESWKQSNERLVKEVDAMRQQFQNMSTPSKQKDERKSGNLTEKQKQERADKRRIQCTYCKTRGHVEAECNKKKKDQERTAANAAQTPPAPQ